MNIHYISCHSVLEYDEVKLLTELGHNVFSNGAYLEPTGHISLPRPGIDGAKKWDDLVKIAIDNPKTNLPKELIDPFDYIIVMHTPDVITNNWENIKHKKVIWRTIGQSTPGVERKLNKARSEGLRIVRYSPKETNIENYIGEDTLIRFYKDPDVFNGWVGNSDQVVNFTQSLKGRGTFVHHEEIMGSIIGYNSKIYGTGNDDLGQFNGGEVSFNKMIDILRQARVFVYGGTWPASYTLSFIEALMIGVPIVAIGRRLAHIGNYEPIDFYEVDEIIKSGENGFIGESIQEIRHYIELLLNNYDLAKKISANGRETAIKLFGKKQIADQWREFLAK